MAVTPQADVELDLTAGRSWTATFSRRRADQVTRLSLDGYETGVAQMRARAGDVGDPLIEFAVEINHVAVLDDDDNVIRAADTVTVTATAEQSAEVGPGVYRFDCALVHDNGVDVIDICPNVPIRVGAAVSVIP